jgi:hypothetical protein
MFLDGECSKIDPKMAHSVYNISDYLRTLLKNDATNLAQIFDGLYNIKYNNSGVNLDPVWVDGVKAVAWYGCINQTKTLPGVQIGVTFTGKQSEFKSYSNYENPVVASVTLTVYKGELLRFTLSNLFDLADNLTSPKQITYIEDHSFNVVELEYTKTEHKAEAIKVSKFELGMIIHLYF